MCCIFRSAYSDNSLGLLSFRGATKGAGGCSSTPQPKKVCPVIRPDPMTFFSGGWGTCTCTIMNTYFRYFKTALSNSPVSDYQRACISVFTYRLQLTIVEVLSEGTLLMSVADIHVN